VTTVKRFEMQAPHGTRIFASMHGCVIEYSESLRHTVIDWLRSELVRFEQASAMQEELIVCPRCGGKLEMRGDVPVVCTLCHGRGKVTKPMAEAFAQSSKQGQMVVRQQSLPPVIAPQPAIVMTTTVIEEDDYQAPQPGDAGFIGPIQQSDTSTYLG
jgi:hypothetical protein